MPVAVRSFAKINIGLEIGPRRADGFHSLRTVYQTVALHDRLRRGRLALARVGETPTRTAAGTAALRYLG